MKKKLLTIILFSGTMLCNVSVVNAVEPRYTFTNLSSGDFGGTATAINNLGQITGNTSVAVPFPNVPGSFIVSSTATLWNSISASGNFLTTPSIDFRSIVSDLNDSGQIVGYTADNLGNFTPTLWENGQTKSLPFLANNDTFGMAQGINNSGEIVGITGPGFGESITHWNNNLVPTSNGTSFGPEYSINDKGQIAGIFESNPMNFDAGIWTDGSLTNIGTLGGPFANPSDINNEGVVVGSASTVTGNLRAFIYDGDDMTALRMIPDGNGGSTAANAINELGQVVGHSISDGVSHATLWNGYEVYDLNNFLDAGSKSAGWVLTDALDINDQGWIVGTATNFQTDESHAFVLSSDNAIPPVPEPSTYAMLIAGLGMLAFMTRHKNI